MNNKKIYIIVLISVVFIIILSYIIYWNNIHNEKKEQVDTMSENMTEIYNEILQVTKTKVCNINQQEITNEDVLLTKIFNQEDNEETAKKKTIEDTALLQEINKKEIGLNQKDSEYIDEIMDDLDNNSKFNTNYSETEKKEILNVISEKLYNDALINQYKSQIIREISNRTFTPKNENIANEYRKYLKIQEKWDNKQNISYKQLQEARDIFMEVYIKELLSETVIE